jgi:hypothetical protein
MHIHRLVVAAAALAAAVPTLAHDDARCSVATLNGIYLWNGTGATAPAGTSWVPKAINEQMRFDGAGTVTLLAGTIANRGGDGQVTVLPPGLTGSYTVEPGCTGRVQFMPAPGFNLVLAPGGRVGSFLQTDAGNVLLGTLERVSR